MSFAVGTPPLRDVHHVYFTRTFCPGRDNRGSYVRLHFFLRQAEAQPTAEAELDRQLWLYQHGGGTVVSIHKEPPIDGVTVEAAFKGAEAFPALYYDYVEHLSRVAVELFQRTDVPVDKLATIGAWGHNLSNVLLGDDMWDQVIRCQQGEIERLKAALAGGPSP